MYCYVLERNTACVFHSMRVAEVGLRAFARRVKVQMPKGKKIEWAQWQEVLREIRKKIDLMGQSAKPGPVKDDLMDFYNGAYGQFMGFKDEFLLANARERHRPPGAQAPTFPSPRQP